MINIVIADSQFLIVEALQSMISQKADYSVGGVARSQPELFKYLETTKGGLLIIDPSNLLNDHTVIIQIKRQFPRFSWLVLTNILTKAEFDALIQFGIRNIVYKNTEKQELLTAIESTLNGKNYFSDEVLDLALETNEKQAIPKDSANLTSSEMDIVKMISQGFTTKEIASKRHVSHHTVNTHRKNIFRKMEVTNSSELIMKAIKSGWIDNIEYYI